MSEGGSNMTKPYSLFL